MLAYCFVDVVNDDMRVLKWQLFKKARKRKGKTGYKEYTRTCKIESLQALMLRRKTNCLNDIFNELKTYQTNECDNITQIPVLTDLNVILINIHLQKP